jgi:hypothetical protein
MAAIFILTYGLLGACACAVAIGIKRLATR